MIAFIPNHPHETLLPQLIVAHLIGDFLFQSHWMASNKAKSSFVCVVHVAFYLVPFFMVWSMNPFQWQNNIPLWMYAAIAVQHFLQDRFQLHLKWMKFYGQTPPEHWPTGPLCVDQAWHIAFLWLFSMML